MPAIDSNAVARGTKRLFEMFTSEQLARLQSLERDPDLDERVSHLAELANEGELTAEQEAEYLGYIEANSILAVLQDAARQLTVS
jgi:hypothetical protein